MAGQMWDLAATPMGKAITAGDVETLNRLAKVEGENYFFRDRKQNTYIHYVCTMYRPSVFYALVALGIDLSAQNRHGNTALHVTALQRECCHVSDLMCCGIDPFIKNKDGKMAEQLDSQNRFWHYIYEQYKPGIFQAVRDHDLEKIQYLLRCWVRIDCKYKKQTLRQFAACLKFHDIVVIIDEHKATTDMIYGVFEGNHDKVTEALKKTRCRVNFLNEISAKRHILQYAIKFRDCEFVRMLCAKGADVNTKTRVNNYFWGPLFFEVFHKDTPLDIIWHVLKSSADFTMKDERGRTAFMYALDKTNGHLPIEIFQFMLKKGTDITERDCTGCNPRDIARFARRLDVVELIDKYYIKIIRDSDIESLTKMAVNGYDSLIISHNYRDTFIYASGNRTDDVVQFVNWLPRFLDEVKDLHEAVIHSTEAEVLRCLEHSPSPDLVVRTRNQARRTPLIQAVIFGRLDVIQLFLGLKYSIDIDAQDCCYRSAYHFACCLSGELGQQIRDALINAGANTDLKDVLGQSGEAFAVKVGGEKLIHKERQAVYGMVAELHCADKYEELRKIIRSKRKSLPEFLDYLRHYKFPVVAFHKVLSPLMSTYRDPIFLAIDYGKIEIAMKLADLGSDLSRTETYDRTTEEKKTISTSYTPPERASHLGMDDLARYLDNKRAIQLDKRQHNLPLVPQRALSRHFDIGFSSVGPCVFATQQSVI